MGSYRNYTSMRGTRSNGYASHRGMSANSKRMPKVQPPKGSYLDKNGQRWTTLYFDVVTGFGRGEKFIRQVSYDFTTDFVFELGKYVVNMDYGNLQDILLAKYPSLKRYKGLRFVWTDHKVH